MVNAFEREWQVRYDLAAAAATQAREKRREAARLAKPLTPPDSHHVLIYLLRSFIYFVFYRRELVPDVKKYNRLLVIT